MWYGLKETIISSSEPDKEVSFCLEKKSERPELLSGVTVELEYAGEGKVNEVFELPHRIIIY